LRIIGTNRIRRLGPDECVAHLDVQNAPMALKGVKQTEKKKNRLKKNVIEGYSRERDGGKS